MPTIDLSTPPPPPAGLLDALPRRVSLTLPELRLVAERAGGAPLPFDLVDGGARPGGSALDGRLGQSRGTAETTAYAAALDALHDPETSLTRRGLLTGRTVDDGLLGAVGLLATPSVALDLDVTVGGVQAKAWHRQDGAAVATLATVDGIVFELAWLPTALWPGELARTTVVPEDVTLHESAVPSLVTLPFELADAAGEALRTGRSDLVPVLAAQHHGQVVDGTGTLLGDADVVGLLTAVAHESRGRLRALVADVSGSETTVVGVVSWVLLADGWRSLRPHEVDGVQRVELRRVQPNDLAADLAPVLAEVVG
ncbi:hypothetical protein H5V45_10225 [Nocardioides sp. KIGAM211]|uniref:Uncharacterized protein n=1 Tax=Nocardioides luti TaxID=2761101 RepID=A0A7X0RG65_9ACTN|nr:hypothetical protein [Nocardioides luti]MBB6627696.1 hypothetical protein [Nocardioides luti]